MNHSQKAIQPAGKVVTSLYGSETKMIETKQKNLGGNAEAKADASAGRGLFA